MSLEFIALSNTDNSRFREIENLPDPERVIEGLRDTGYDFNTAIADIVDNSISANATHVDILVDLDPQLEVTVYISDNGTGMNEDDLINAMKYGSKRRPAQKSLGKFGLGLKTASTAFCRKLSLISRGSDHEVMKVQWDLDHVSIAGWKLKSFSPDQDEIERLELTAGEGTGTVVVWENCDRILPRAYVQESAAKRAFKKMIEDLQFHLSAVYQRFLDPHFTEANNVSISLNGASVQPWDPFCRTEPNTHELAKKRYNVNGLPSGDSSWFTLAAYSIPRSKTYTSPESEREARISTSTMGFYIYRENRLIHYGDWLNMFVKDPHDSLLRIDFSFDHTLDDAFNIDIKKSRVQLNAEIYAQIKDQFLPGPKREANEKYRTGVDKAVTALSSGAHTESNKSIDQKAASLENAKVTVTNPETGEVEIENVNGKFQHTVTVQEAEEKGEWRVVAAEDLRGGVLWEPAIVDGHHAVRINKSHPYYQKIYFPVLEQKNLVTGMDSLLWALVETELSIYNNMNKETFEDIRNQVSRALIRLVSDLPDPLIPDNN